MRRLLDTPVAAAMMRLCLGAIVAVQALAPGLGLAAQPSGPVVLAVLCAEHGPASVLIDLGTGEPVEAAAHNHCFSCLTCCAPALPPDTATHAPGLPLQPAKVQFPAWQIPASDTRPGPATARGPPLPL